MPLKARPSQMEAFNPTPTTNRSHRGGYGFPSHDQARKSLSTARSPIRGILLLHPDSAYYAHFNIRPDKFCFCGHLVPLDPSHITEDYGPSFGSFPTPPPTALLGSIKRPPRDGKVPARLRSLHIRRTTVHAPHAPDMPAMIY